MATLLRLGLALGLAIAMSSETARRRRKAQAPKLKVDTLEHFEEFCRRFIVLDNGKPFILEPFQKLILRGFFAGVTETLVLLPKKNGKTTLLAALALYHLIYTPDAECYIAASARDQAQIMYRQACGFVERKGRDGKLLPQARALQKRVLLRKGSREIRSKRDSGFIWVLSGDKDTADGVIPTLALVDELHRHKDEGQLYGVLVDGLGPRNGRCITISTAGETMKSALGRLRAAALKMPGLTRKGCYTHVGNEDFEMHEWSLDPEDNREDLRLVKKANPLSNVTVEKLRARRDSPGMTPSRWARFACGVWVQGEDAAVSSVDWSKCVGRPPKKGVNIYLGLDIGWRWDTTAIVPGQPWAREDFLVDNNGRQEKWWRFTRVRYGRPTILVPPRDGTSLRRKLIIDALLAYAEDYEILGVVFDRNAEGEAVAQELEEEHGLVVIEHSQDPSPMADASMGFAEAVGARLIDHPDDPEFSAHVLTAIAKTTSGEKWRFDKPGKRRGQRKQGRQEGEDVEVIDAAIAAAMVHRVATAPQPPEIDRSAYRMEFV